MAHARRVGGKKGFGIVHADMAVCCAVVLIPVAGFFVAGRTVAGLGSSPVVFALTALCIFMHGAMFAFTGKSCHGTSGKPTEDTVFGGAESVPVMVACSRA